MTNREHFNHDVWRTAILTFALVACLAFGIVVLANGDWIPGGIIVAASAVALAGRIRVIRRLFSTGSVTQPKYKPVG